MNAISTYFRDELGRFVAEKRSLTNLKMEGCSNLGGFTLCSTSLSTLSLSDLYCHAKMVCSVWCSAPFFLGCKQTYIWSVFTPVGLQLPQLEGCFPGFFSPRKWHHRSYSHGRWSWKELPETPEHSYCLHPPNTCCCACFNSSKSKVYNVHPIWSFYEFLFTFFPLIKLVIVFYCFKPQGVTDALSCTGFRNNWCICCCYRFKLLKPWVAWFEWVCFPSTPSILWFLHSVGDNK